MIFTNDSGGCTFSHCYITVETGGHFTRYDCLGKTSQKEVTIPSVLYLHVVVCKRALLLWGERPPHHGLCATKGRGQSYTTTTTDCWLICTRKSTYHCWKSNDDIFCVVDTTSVLVVWLGILKKSKKRRRHCAVAIFSWFLLCHWNI